MKPLSKKNSEESYVQGSKQTKAKKPKSLTPKTESNTSGNKRRAGKHGKPLDV